MTKPAWLTKNTPTLDDPPNPVLINHASGVAFVAAKLTSRFAIDGIGNAYRLDTCDLVKLSDFDNERTLIGDRGSKITVQRCTEGLRFNGRLMVRLKTVLDPLDPVSIAAKNLAEFFNGAVAQGEIDLKQFGFTEEGINDDW